MSRNNNYSPVLFPIPTNSSSKNPSTGPGYTGRTTGSLTNGHSYSGACIAKSTKSVYRSGRHQFLKFCQIPHTF